MSGEFAAWLRGLGPQRLAALLAERVDATTPPMPATIEDLAHRLSTERSTARALSGLTVLAHQVMEVIQGIGGEPTRAELDARILLESPADAAAVEIALDSLTRVGLLIQSASESGARLRLVGAARNFWSTPLGLGPSVTQLLPTLQSDVLEQVRLVHSLPRAGSRAKLERALAAALTAERIGEMLLTAPGETGEILAAAATGSPYVPVPGGSIASVLPNRWRQESPLSWLLDRALLLPADYGTLVLPREVALALRDPGWRVRLATAPPEISTAAIDAVSVEREARAAATAFVAALTDLLEHLASTPGTALKAGGVGLREVRRLAKVTGTTEELIALALELAWMAGLVALQNLLVLPTQAYDQWRASEPPERLAGIAATWWTSNGAVTAKEDHNGKAIPPLAGQWADPGVRTLRQGMLAALAALPDGQGAVSPETVLWHVSWLRPFAGRSQTPVPLEQLGAACWREAALLGLAAHGRVTGLGAALLRGDIDALVAAGAALLPAVERAATFQADLTALVAGAPSPELTHLLDTAAEREARGAATIWRFSPPTIRRYLDGGGTAEELATALRAVAKGELPQPLTYLIADVGRRHGHLAVATAACVVLSADPALLAEVAASRSLRSLEAHLLAPTVLASAKPVTETLQLLREAGYAPVRRDRAGQVVIERAKAARAAVRTPWRPLTGADPTVSATPNQQVEQLARSLLGGRTLPPGPVQQTLDEPPAGETIAAYAPSLAVDEVALLAHAVSTGGPVVIDYVSISGKRTQREISDCELIPPFVQAWCHLRADERTFSLSGIVAVAPV